MEDFETLTMETELRFSQAEALLENALFEIRQIAQLPDVINVLKLHIRDIIGTVRIHKTLNTLSATNETRLSMNSTQQPEPQEATAIDNSYDWASPIDLSQTIEHALGGCAQEGAQAKPMDLVIPVRGNEVTPIFNLTLLEEIAPEKFNLVSYRTTALSGPPCPKDEELKEYVEKHFPLWPGRQIRAERAAIIDRLLPRPVLNKGIDTNSSLTSIFQEVFSQLFKEDVYIALVFPKSTGRTLTYSLYTQDVAYICAKVREGIRLPQHLVTPMNVFRAAREGYKRLSPLPYRHKEVVRKKWIRNMLPQVPADKESV